jgi:glucose-6-phosphate 1-epimerase
VVFPQFGRPCEDMSQHGFARTSVWTIAELSSSLSCCSLSLQLHSTPDTLAQWPHAFQLQYTVVLSAQGLQCTLSATNTGDSPFDCHTLLHTYFRVPHISQVKIVGFQGLEYTDKLQGGAVSVSGEDEEAMEISSEVDRVYLSPTASAHSAPPPHPPIPDILITDAHTAQTLVRVHKSASITLGRDGDEMEVPTDCVLWNQWREGSLGMGDMDDDGWEHYVCVEPGTVSELVSVAPLATLSLTQRLLPS